MVAALAAGELDWPRIREYAWGTNVTGGCGGMLDAVGVHGISQQQGGRAQLLGEWRNALTDGVQAARNLQAVQVPLTFDLGYYGNLFLADWPADAKGAATGDAGALKELADGLSEDEQAWFAGIAADLPVADTPPTKASLLALPKPMQRLAAWLDASFGAAAPAMFIGDLRQVRRYQQDDVLAEKIQGRVREAMADGCTVLIGHSLGSVVAYETACAARTRPPSLLLTLGSPLGLATVRKRLRFVGPPADLRWVNVRDPRDPVACAGGLARWWRDTQDVSVDNNDKPHAVNRYLGKWQTGDAVAQALGR